MAAEETDLKYTFLIFVAFFVFEYLWEKDLTLLDQKLLLAKHATVFPTSIHAFKKNYVEWISDKTI